MEVLKCEKGDAFSQQISFTSNSQTKISTASYTCISDCTINLQLKCGWLSTLKGDIVAGNINDVLNQGMIAGGTFTRTYNIGDGEQFSVTAYCDVPILGSQLITIGSASDSIIQIHDYNKYLFASNHEWTDHQLYDTKNCIPQSRVSTFINKQVTSGSLPSVYQTGGTDVLSNDIKTYAADYSISTLNLNSEMKVGNTLSYFYRWEPVSNINLKYDSDKIPVYCGGSSDQRKLINYNTITTNDGCYYVPSTIKRNVECCLDGDCAFAGKICGPGFTCTDKKPCNSVVECGTQESQCNNNILTSWNCDSSQGSVNLPNGMTYSGWCSKQTMNVACCPNSCGTGMHCEYSKGCVSDIRIIDCPTGKCCESGGNYKPQDCPAGFQCCHYGDSIIGECKESCTPTPVQTSQQATTGESIFPSSEGSTPITGNILSNLNSTNLAIIIGAITAISVGVFLIFRNRKSKVTVKETKKPKENKISKGKFCTKCGSKLNEGQKFCTKCGKKAS